jgi:hypothetical protein
MIRALLLQQDLLKSETILVTAPSNAAVANVAFKFYQDCRSDYRSFQEVVVFGENCDASVRFLNPKIRGERFRTLNEKFQEACEKNPSQCDTLRDLFCQELVSWLHLPQDQDWSIAELTQFCPYIDMESPKGREFYASILSESKVVFSTLNSSGSNQLRNNVRVRTLLLDEGGQCPEAEFYIAATFPGVERIIIMGDPKQLPATVIDPECKAAGYGESWLGNVFRLLPENVHLLNTQYRMDPQILAFPNKEFYSGRILSGNNVYSRSPLVGKPFLFVDTKRRGREEKDGFSWMNTYELTVIKSLIFTDEDIVRVLKDSLDMVRIIIITPYKSQAKLLREKIPKSRQYQLEVATVDSFQGQEADIVIMSTVRTHRTGFVDDEQRLNVDLTRAKRILRVVGDAEFFLSL